MSVVKVRTALETALNAMSPALSTAFENAAFTPVAGTPYQKCHVLFAKPDNQQYGSGHKELGFMQVTLMYPLQVGTATAAARAELIRATFTRGSTFVSGGVTVNVMETPEVSPGSVDGDRFEIPIKIPFYAYI